VNEPLQIALMLPAGMLLGALFFGGLWWTVQKGLASTQPALWFGASLLLRSAIVLAGFYYFAGPHWQRLLACLSGFIAARVVVTRLTAKRMPEGTSHAP
jgi:F1F0 ATPase subunit 2